MFCYVLVAVLVFLVNLEGVEVVDLHDILHSHISVFGPPTEPRAINVPFQANVIYRTDNSRFQSFCGGSLIHLRWILTAAHCLEQDDRLLPAKNVYVSLGSEYINGTGGQMIQASKLYLNKLYFQSEYGYDIGLIKLKNHATLGSNVKPIKLHTNNAESLIGQDAFLTGFGAINDFYQQPSQMRMAFLHIVTPDKCLMKVRSGFPEICCSSTLEEGKACKGDSGGPLIIKVNGTVLQVGITSRLSFLPICAVTINNSIYTRVSSYINWISKATGIDFRKYTPPESERIL